MQDSEFLFLTNENKTLSGVDELKCPAEIYVPNGVTKIERRAFASCPAKKIFLPDTVTQIGYEAFYGCDALEYVRFPKKLESVEPAIFRECFSLQKVELGDEISAFSESMFECCYSLKEASFRIGITELPRNLFSECFSLESLVIPEGVAVIRSGAAAYCQSLSTLVLPSSMRIIEDDAFRNCVNLAHIRFSAENSVFFTDEESGALFERRADDTFSLIKVPVKATQIRIPKNVTHSHSEAFQGCNSIEKVYIDCDLVDHPLFVALKTEIVDAEFINENEEEEKRISPEPEIENNEIEETPDLEKNADAEVPEEKETPPKKPRKPRQKKQKPAIIEESLSEEPREKTPDLEKGADVEVQEEKETPPKKPRKPRQKKQKPAIIEESLSEEPSEPQIKIDTPAFETADAKAKNKAKAEKAHSEESAANDNAIADEPLSADEYEIAFEPQIEEPDESEDALVAAEAEVAHSEDAAASDDAIADEPLSADEYEIAFEPQIEEPDESEDALVSIEAEVAHSEGNAASDDAIADEPLSADEYEVAFEPQIEEPDESEDVLVSVEVEVAHSEENAASDDAIADEPLSADEYEVAFEPQIEEPDESEDALVSAEAEVVHSEENAASDDAIAAILEQNIASAEPTEEDELRGITITIEELDEAMMRGIQEEEESDYRIPEGIFPTNDAEEVPEDLPPPEPRFVNGMISVSGAFEVIDEKTLYPDRAEEDLCAFAPNEMEDITTLVGVTESLNNDEKISESAKEFCIALAKKYDLKRVYLFGALALDNEEFLYGFQKFALYRNVVFVPDAANFDSLSSEVKTFAEIAEFGTAEFYNLKGKDLPELELPFKIFACENSQIEEIAEEKTEQEEIATKTIPDTEQENSAPQTQKKNPVTGKGLLARAQEKEFASKKGLLAKAQSTLNKESAD